MGRGRAGRTLVLLPVVAVLAAAAAVSVASAHHCGLLNALCGHSRDGSSQAADPGGSATARVPVPPRGKRFGFNWIYQRRFTSAVLSDAREARLHSNAGANTFRITFLWDVLEPRRDSWDRYQLRLRDRLVRAYIRRGVRPLIVLQGTPRWARERRLGCNRMCPPRRSMYREWREFAARIARRYDEAVAIEVWNEPNLPTFFRPRPNPRRYAELQAHAYRAVKRANPGMAVGTGGFAGNVVFGRDGSWPIGAFLDVAYENGLKRHMDFLSFHAYPYSARLGRGSLFARVFQEVRSATRRHGDRGRRLWVTEAGYTTTGLEEHRVSPPAQARLLRRLYRKTLSMPDVEALIVHTLIDDASRYSRLGPGRGFGVIARSGGLAPKPAYCWFVGASGSRYRGCPD